MEESAALVELFPKPMPGSGLDAENDRLKASDNDLVRRANRGDAAALDELVNRHAPGLFSLALAMLRHRADAEDAVQETLLGAVRGLRGFRQQASLRTWLSGILMRQIARQRRERWRKPMKLVGEQDDWPPPPRAEQDASASVVPSRLDVHEMLAALSTEHRQVLVLRELEGLSYEEIATALKVPRGTVESRLHRARAELRERYKGYFG